MRRRLIASLTMCALAALALAPATVGHEAAVDRLDRLRHGLLPEPRRAARDPDADRPEGCRLRGAPARLSPEVTLTNLDGSGYLVGDWANIRAETGTPAYSPTNTFDFHRDDDRFEQVMAYYWVTEAQKYIQSLGFGSTRRAVNKESQDIRTNQYRRRQLVLVGQARPPALRQGRGRRRRGRRGDPPRVRPRDPGLAGRGVRRRAGGRRDRRGLRRLLGRDRHERHRADGRRAVRGRLGCGLVHLRPCRTACAAWTRTPTTRRTSGTRSIATA